MHIGGDALDRPRPRAVAVKPIAHGRFHAPVPGVKCGTFILCWVIEILEHAVSAWLRSVRAAGLRHARVFGHGSPGQSHLLILKVPRG